MKRTLSLILSILLIASLLCSCEKNENDTQNNIQAEVYYDYFSHNCYSSFSAFETDEGYYYLKFNNDYENGLIYYAEKDSTNFAILCNKPDCDHCDENCNAYGGTYMGYYNGKIYCVLLSSSSGHILTRMNMDGTNHEKVADLPEAYSQNGVGANVIGGTYRFYKGFIINIIGLTVEKRINYPVAYRINLETGQSTLLFDDELSDYAGTVRSICPYGNTAWFGARLRNGSTIDWFCLNIDTGEIIDKFNQKSELYGTKNIDGLLYYYKKNTGFCEYNPETEEEKLLKQYDYAIANVVYGENNIYAKVWKIDSEGKKYDSQMIILDKEYNVIAQAELPTDNVTNMNFLSVTSDYIFMYEGNTVPTGITHYIDLNKISDGKMTVEKIQ